MNVTCNNCQGKGTVRTRFGNKTCPFCRGTGTVLQEKQSKVQEEETKVLKTRLLG